MALVLLLSDRTPVEVLPAMASLGLDLKVGDLSTATAREVPALGPELVLVDAAANPGQGHAVLRALHDTDPSRQVAVVIEPRDLERFGWEVADGLLFPGTGEAEIRVRLAMLRRRSATSDGSTIRLGPLSLDVDTYRVTLQGRALDLTFKEFELLRYLAERPGHVCSRPRLLREVWGFDFYGGTRTVDVHIRRLRAKLGPEHEGLIQTVRGVGYRAAEP